MRKLVLFPVVFLCLRAFSQEDSSVVKFMNPPTLSVPKGYSHAATIDLGTCKMLLISGQVALDQQGQLVGKGDVGRQTEQVFQNIRKIVEAAGGNMSQVVKLNYFLVDASQIQAVRNARDKYINTKNLPVSTLVQVSRLFREDILIEVEATVVIPSAR